MRLCSEVGVFTESAIRRSNNCCSQSVMRSSCFSSSHFVAFSVSLWFLLYQGGRAQAPKAPVLKASTCTVLLRFTTVPTEHNGDRNCKATGLQLLCGGMCDSAAFPVQEQDKVVYVPECRTCTGTVQRIISVPFTIECVGKDNVIEYRNTPIPRCSCKRCHEHSPFVVPSK